VAIIAAGRVIAEGAPAELIVRHLARDAGELECDAGEEPRLLDGLASVRRLRTGSRLMVYLHDSAPLVERVRGLDPNDRRALVVRPANLEDVFLAMTGTNLEGGA
jgi:lipooligosaccharide transport system ATP-binding protein